MNAAEFYVELCKEAGTYKGGDITPLEWLAACMHNITPDQIKTLRAAAAGDASAIAEARKDVGLPVFS
jgi:hypothetical protein